MDIMVFAPCEKVVKRRGGWVDLLGFGIQNIKLRRPEGQIEGQALIDVYCLLRFFPQDTGRKYLQIALISPDGETLAKSNIREFDAPGSQSIVNITGEFPLRTRVSGAHSLDLVINERTEASWTMGIELL